MDADAAATRTPSGPPRPHPNEVWSESLRRGARIFGSFWWDFLVGDTPELFLAVVVVVVLALALRRHHEIAVVLLPVVTVVFLLASVLRGRTRREGEDRVRRRYDPSASVCAKRLRTRLTRRLFLGPVALVSVMASGWTGSASSTGALRRTRFAEWRGRPHRGDSGIAPARRCRGRNEDDSSLR